MKLGYFLSSEEYVSGQWRWRLAGDPQEAVRTINRLWPNEALGGELAQEFADARVEAFFDGPARELLGRFR